MPRRPRNRASPSFTLTGKYLLLTYPKCDVPKETYLSRLHSLFDGSPTVPRPTVVVVGRELHADGTPHLHVALRFAETFTTHIATFFDFPTGKHGNYKRRQNWKTTVAYCVKEDTNPCLSGMTYEELQKLVGSLKGSISDHIARRCMKAEPLDTIAQDYPGYFLQHKRQIESFHSWINSGARKTTPDYPGIKYLGSQSATSAVVKWLQDNIKTNRKFKSRQLYIHGPANCGKTSLVLMLETWLKIYWVPQFEDYYDMYEDSYDLVFYDEFYGSQKKIQWLNLFLQGGPMTVARKGSQYLKRANHPLIICSNVSPREAYPNVKPLIMDALLKRLQVVELSEKLDFDNIVFEHPTDAEQEHMDSCNEALCPLCGLYNMDCACPSRQPPQAQASTSTSSFFNHPFIAGIRNIIQSTTGQVHPVSSP